MIWWIQARRLVPVLGPGVVLFTILVVLFTDAQANLVSWTVGSQVIPIVTFAPLAVAATLAICLDSRLPEAELTSIRRIPLLDAGLIVVLLLLALGVSWFAFGLTHDEATLTVGRNTVFLVGLMLIARSFTNRGGIVVATGWVMVVILVGRRTSSDYYPWAVTGLPLSTVHAATAAVATFTFGVLLTYLTARKLP